jgi:hypothetical protein
MTTNSKMTPAEAAAFKSANMAQSPIVVHIDRQPVKRSKSQRQEWQEFRTETLGMIEAAKRQRLFDLLPKLMQRLSTADQMIANHAIN